MSANIRTRSELSNGQMKPQTDLRGKVTTDELIAAGDAGEIDTVFAVVPDNAGRLRGHRLHLNVFREHIESDTPLPFALAVWGVDIESSFRPGLDAMGGLTSGASDCAAKPDLSSMRLLPWLAKTVVVFCDAYLESSVPLAVAPRTILRQQLDRLAGLGLTIKVATELEFNLFKETYVDAWDDGYKRLTPNSRYQAPYDTLQPTFDEPFLDALRRMMQLAGIEVEGLVTEYGLGQQELKLRYCDPVEMADRHALYKWGAKALAAEVGMSVTFMAKWNQTELGNSCHIHTSLWSADGERPRGSVEGSGSAPTDELKHFLAGMVDTTRELTYLYAPTLNSYRRFAAGSLAPTVLVWGDDNRSCAFRMLGNGQSLRIENRVPGADVNPCLAIAAMVAGGVHGLESRLSLPPGTPGNAYAVRDREMLPTSLPEALDCFEESELAVRVFTPEVHRHLLTVGREELTAFLSETVTDWEMRRYFERI
jgi:glutamine synthetase